MATGGFEVVTKRSEKKKDPTFPAGEGKGPRMAQGAARFSGERGNRGRGNRGRGEFRQTDAPNQQ